MPDAVESTRRTFLKTAASIAAPMIVPASALGLGDATAPSERVTIGCIGVGNRGSSNMRAFLDAPGAQVVAVCDVDRAHRERAREQSELNEDAAYLDYREILARDDIDAVSIGTPDHWHAINTIEAADAGKDIFCEKPVSLTIAEGRQMADAVARNERILQVGTWRRSLEPCRRACELVRNGYIGELRSIECGVPEGYQIRGDFEPGHPTVPVPDGFDYDRWLGPAPKKPYTPGRCHFNFRWLLDYSAGYITDWGAHYYDIAQWGNGTDDTGPVHIAGYAEFPREGLYDASVKHLIEFEYANGVRLIALSSSDSAKHGIRFFGSEGWIHVESNTITSAPESLATVELKDSDTRLYASDNHLYNFIECVLERKTPAAPIEVGHRSASICHLGHIATTLKRELQWDPVKEQFVGDDEADAMRDRPKRAPWIV